MRRTDRELRRVGLEYERMPAVDGRALTKSQWIEATGPVCRYFCTEAIVGIFLSHRKCWSEVVRRGLPYAVVLEDDVMLEDDFSEVARNLARRSSWDMILLGCFFCRRPPPDPSPSSDPGVFKPAHWAGTHAYLVSARGACKLLQRHTRVSFHVDIALLWDSEIELYVSKRQVARQRALASESHNARGVWSAFDAIRLDGGRVGLGFVLGSRHAKIMGFYVSAGNFLVALAVVLLVWRLCF
jgi:GR25 family glycosyltransferase involved in LPS biosynthesis